MHERKLLAPLIITVCCGLAAGCGSAASSPPGVDWNGYRAEYRVEATKLHLPPSARWPSRPPEAKTAPDGGEIFFEVGTGKSDADRYWFCSWAREWLATQTADPARAKTALARLDALRSTFLYRGATQSNDRHLYDDQVHRAALGDPGPLHREVQLNCPRPA